MESMGLGLVSTSDMPATEDAPWPVTGLYVGLAAWRMARFASLRFFLSARSMISCNGRRESFDRDQQMTHLNLANAHSATDPPPPTQPRLPEDGRV